VYLLWTLSSRPKCTIESWRCKVYDSAKSFPDGCSIGHHSESNENEKNYEMFKTADNQIFSTH